jgi:sarcosine oxidase
VIVIGLGCVGLSTTYYLSKFGNMKVLGLERNGVSGDLGSSSYSYGRIWRTMDVDARYSNMQKEAMEIWDDVSKESGNELLIRNGILYVKDPKGKGESFKTLS